MAGVPNVSFASGSSANPICGKRTRDSQDTSKMKSTQEKVDLLRVFEIVGSHIYSFIRPEEFIAIWSFIRYHKPNDRSSPMLQATMKTIVSISRLSKGFHEFSVRYFSNKHKMYYQTFCN